MVIRFQIIQTLGKNESVSIFFCEFHCTHAKDNKKKYVGKKWPDKPANQEVNFDVIGKVIMFATLHAKV